VSGEGDSKWVCESSAMGRPPVNTNEHGEEPEPNKSNQPTWYSLCLSRTMFFPGIIMSAPPYTHEKQKRGDETVSERVDHCVTISRVVWSAAASGSAV